jgi:sodium-dependent dicarboxylate transporter 2/3/5
LLQINLTWFANLANACIEQNTFNLKIQKMKKITFKQIAETAGFIGTLPARKLADAFAFVGQQSRLNRIMPPLRRRDLTVFFTALLPAVFIAWYLRDLEGVRPETANMAGIFVLACLLWATEALPLFATSLLIIGLEILLLANPAQWEGLGLSSGDPIDYLYFLKPMSDPVVVLFLGGFILARASVKAGVDNLIAAKLLKPFTASPSRMLLGVILITAIFSMWMSNTATTAMMLSLLAPVLIQLKDEPLLSRGLVLAVPISANLGGMGTPVASPPNAVAVGYLSNLGYKINFSDWVIAAVPVMIFMLWLTWKLLHKRYNPEKKAFVFQLSEARHGRWANFVMFVFAVTVLLWLTEAVHGVPAPVISLIPVLAFTVTGLIDRNDINSLEWSILLLIAGGIALGMGMKLTGLDDLIVSSINADSLLLVPVLILGMILLSNFMSNTAAANLMIPIGIGMMQLQSFGPLATLAGTFSIALAASMSMVLPVSTPPNALAYASGKLESGDFRYMGIVLGFTGLVLLILLFSAAGFGHKLGLFPDL